MASDLPSGDPALLNRIAWARRWNDRKASLSYALEARKKALDGQGRRSRAEQGFALRTLGWHALWRGDLKLAMDYCLRAETYLPESDFAHVRAGIYSLIGKVHYNRNRFDLAICSIERGLWLVQDSEDDPATLADLMLSQTAIQRRTGERARAGITLGRARSLATGDNAALVDICTTYLLLDDRDTVQALEYARTAVTYCEEAGNEVILPFARAALAACLTARGNHLDAYEQIKTGLAALDDNNHWAQCLLLRCLADHHLGKGEQSKALEILKKAATIADAHAFKLMHKNIALIHADTLEETGEYKAALDQHKLAWRLQNETRLR
ncbi:hypothetical protein N9L47_03905 [Rhodobacteraceae bacterium]|nr:hypothetical protein [Paracoccaceae bacterium]